MVNPVASKLGLPTSVANSPATVNWPASRNAWNRLGGGLCGAVSTHKISTLKSTLP